MSFDTLFKLAMVGTLAALGTGAQAGAVDCGSPTLGLRVTAVDPALSPNGLCYAQVGALALEAGSPQTFTANGVLLSLLEVDSGPNTTGLVGATINGGTNAGNWTVSATAWQQWTDLYIGFHFGNGKDNTSGNPDSFIVQLAPSDLAGTWALRNRTGTTAGIQTTGLADVYLFGTGPRTQNVPEPASLALAGLALIGLAAVRHRKA